MDDTTWLMEALGEKLLELSRERIEGGPGGRAAPLITIAEVGADFVTLRADPFASYLIEGWDEKPMTWLLGKSVAFTPKGGGERIVRKVTAASIAKGSWVRPARSPNDVFEDAFQSAAMHDELQSLVDILAEELTPPQGAASVTWSTAMDSGDDDTFLGAVTTGGMTGPVGDGRTALPGQDDWGMPT